MEKQKRTTAVIKKDLKEKLKKIGINSFDVRVQKNDIQIPSQKLEFDWELFCAKTIERVKQYDEELARAINEYAEWNRDLGMESGSAGEYPSMIIEKKEAGNLFNAKKIGEKRIIKNNIFASGPLAIKARGEKYIHIGLNENFKIMRIVIKESEIYSVYKRLLFKYSNSRKINELKMKSMFSDTLDYQQKTEIDNLFEELNMQKLKRSDDMMKEFLKTFEEQYRPFEEEIINK